MAKRTFQEIMTEISAITSEYSAMILDAHENNVPFSEDDEAYRKLIILRDRLDALLIPILELRDHQDRSLANERVAVMMNVVGASISSIEQKDS